MKDIREIHRKAMDLARQANDALLAGNKELFISLSKSSFEFEKEAAFELVSDLASEPTRSVLFRSAATLAFNIGNFQEAQKLIHFALAGNPFPEIIEELDLLLSKSKDALEIKTSVAEATENTYLSLLREKAINLRIEPKEKKYSKAVVLSHIIDFLKNVQNSYQNFSEINFKRNFSQTDFKEWDSVLSLFKQETKPLCVDLKWNSFGVSIVADSEIMNYNNFYGDKFINFKKELFEDFKKEVLLPDLNSEEFQNAIKEKYTNEERAQIFTPILESLKERSQYNVSIADKNFKSIIKVFNPVNQKSQQVLKPKIEKTQEDNDEPKVIKRTFELASPSGGSKSKLFSDHLDYAEFRITSTNISFGGKQVSFTNQFEYKIIFNHGTFVIDDSFYKIYVEDKEYKDIQKKFEKAFIEKYMYLLENIESLSQEEKTILDSLETTSMRDW